MDCWVFLQELKVSPSILMEDRQKACSGSDSSELSMDPELWLIAEQSTKEILSAVQPNVASEWRRRELIDYIQRVIKGCFGTEVRHPPVPSFPFLSLFFFLHIFLSRERGKGGRVFCANFY